MNVSNRACSQERRVFLLKLAVSAAMMAGARVATAADKLDPTDSYARSMGYVLNTEEVDQARFPRHTKEQNCHGCKLWNGMDKDFGNCSFFDGSLSPKNGWCKNFKVPKPPAA